MTSPLNIGQWNARRDRNPQRVAAYLRLMCRRHHLDVVLLQEARQYRAILRNGVPGYRLVCPDRPAVRGDEHQAFLVRKGVKVTRARVKRMSRRGWFTKTGAKHAPAYAPVAVFDKWLRVMNVHAPVSVSWPTGQLRSTPKGPTRRVAAYIDHSRRIVKWIHRLQKHNPRALVNIDGAAGLVAGDWNAHPREIGRYSPAWIARNTGWHIHLPPQDGPGHKRLDFPITNTRLTNLQRHGTGGSDHPFITYTVSPWT